MARILHWSDNHGHIPQFHGTYDFSLNTGDFFPNSHHIHQGNKNREMAFQLQWLRDNASFLKEKLQGRPFLFVPGNHDILPPDTMEAELRAADIEAYNITDKVFSFMGINFYGFPYIPYIEGTWNYELKLPEMQIKVDEMVEVLNSTYVDVLCCHCPPYGCLDLSYTNDHWGSTAIANALDYKINKDMMPRTLCVGHIHDASAMTVRGNVLVSNAATTQCVIEI